ncbi:MAG: hypothetical protein LBF42_01050, partial [Puniceicoccales bacterium]|nr:hypothetical protein [Puniceicoccales bacterium]
DQDGKIGLFVGLDVSFQLEAIFFPDNMLQLEGKHEIKLPTGTWFHNYLVATLVYIWGGK